MFDSAFVNITVNANPAVAVAVTPNNTICNGGTVNLAATGANSYLWSPTTFLSSSTSANPVSTPTASITYNVQGTGANGCVSNVTVPITVLNPPAAAMVMSDTFICINGTITYDGSNSVDATTFAWSFPGGTPSTSTSSAPVITYNTAGTYTAQLIVTNTCGADTINYNTVGVGCVGIEEISEGWNINYYPAMDVLTVIAPQGNVSGSIVVTNSLGQQIVSMNAGTSPAYINTASFASGMYIVTVSGSQGSSFMKFVVE
jgi:hypothetical protein